jgi:hypothetical protein
MGSKEITTKQVHAVRFGFYTDEEVSQICMHGPCLACWAD